METECNGHLCITTDSRIMRGFCLFVIYSKARQMDWSPRYDQKTLKLASPPPKKNIIARFYTVGWSTLSFHLDIPKMLMDSSKNGRWIVSFKKFGMVRVKKRHVKTSPTKTTPLVSQKYYVTDNLHHSILSCNCNGHRGSGQNSLSFQTGQPQQHL